MASALRRGQQRQLPADRALQRRPGRPSGAPRPPRAAEPRRAGVGQDHVEREHVVDRRAVPDRVAARRVVADHPAERGPVRWSRCPGRTSARARGRAVELLLHDPRLHPGEPAVASTSRIRLMCREKSTTTRRPTVWPARLVPAPRGRTGHAELAGGGHHGGHLGRIPGEHHAERLDRVHARVAGEQVPGIRIKSDPAADHALQRRCQFSSVSGLAWHVSTPVRARLAGRSRMGGRGHEKPSDRPGRAWSRSRAARRCRCCGRTGGARRWRPAA